MKKLILTVLTILMGFGFVQTGSASTIGLFEWKVIGDGAFQFAAFNQTTGLGTITSKITGVGNHYSGAFFDYEIDESVNTYFNEYGSVSGSAASGQSWEIDEPTGTEGIAGDIYSNFGLKSLDNSNGVISDNPDDVSMAMAWSFSLAADETAEIKWILGLTAPTAGGFYLTHTEAPYLSVTGQEIMPDTIYFSSSLEIKGGGTPPVPEPSTMILFGLGLLGLAKAGRKR